MTLIVSNVSKVYASRGSSSTVKALTDVSLTVERGRTLGIIGESGCGKSTLARQMVGLEAPTSGSVTFDGTPVEHLHRRSLREERRKVQMVFQDPYASLNPRLTAGDAIEEVLLFHSRVQGRQAARTRSQELLETVGLPARVHSAFPAQMSGGQRQRVSIARAIAAEPELLILDEPVSALDVSVRAGIMNLLADLRGLFNLTYVFISHDLSMVRHISDDVAVMYLGRVVEKGPWEQVMDAPQHPYTVALLKSAPAPIVADGPRTILPVLEGEVPSPANQPSGCAFHPRCTVALPTCSSQAPELRNAGPAHDVRCVLVGIEAPV
jgi:oligopeptide/dipeptide ABC transporter ATP-binding protein